MKRLVLFDIDGTLLWPNGAGRESLKAALLEVYGTAGEIDSHAFAGKTDRRNVREILSTANLPESLIWDRFARLEPVMEATLRQRVAQGLHNLNACPGTHDLIHALSLRGDVLLGLLTGNFPKTAAAKLEAAAFDPNLFRVGAYGSEAENRADLPALALERATQLTGHRLVGPQVVIVGDTPDDVTCGRGIGARSLAVMTGWCTCEALEAAQPDYLFDDLSDTQAVLDAIFAPLAGESAQTEV